MKVQVQGEHGELTFHTDMIEVTSNLSKPDRNWRHTDLNRHEHYWTADGYVTLTRVVDSVWTDEDGEQIEETHLACKLCGETVVPGTTGPSGFREFAPGRTSYLLDGQRISKDRAEEIMAAYRRGA